MSIFWVESFLYLNLDTTYTYFSKIFLIKKDKY